MALLLIFSLGCDQVGDFEISSSVQRKLLHPTTIRLHLVCTTFVPISLALQLMDR